MKKKLIEVALPLDAINKASAREKSIRQGYNAVQNLDLDHLLAYAAHAAAWKTPPETIA
jgi:putative DNA methylase